MPIGDIEKFRKGIQHISTAEIDLEYNPLSIRSEDLEYFDFRAAHYLNGEWLRGRAKLIDGTPRIFYTVLVYIHIWITKLIGREC
jgi:hypothetical protein